MHSETQIMYSKRTAAGISIHSEKPSQTHSEKYRNTHIHTQATHLTRKGQHISIAAHNSI